jgi:hypothetical protein
MRHLEGISLMACGRGSRVKPSLESLLDHGNSCLGFERQTIPVLKWPGVESGCEEETDGIHYKLLISVGAVAKEGHLSTFFDSLKEDFGIVSGQVRAAELCVIGFEDGGCGLAIDCAELIKNVDHLPTCFMPWQMTMMRTHLVPQHVRYSPLPASVQRTPAPHARIATLQQATPTRLVFDDFAYPSGPNRTPQPSPPPLPRVSVTQRLIAHCTRSRLAPPCHSSLAALVQYHIPTAKTTRSQHTLVSQFSGLCQALALL